METVTLPRAFIEELFEYFYTQLPMKQSEMVVNEFRRALAASTNEQPAPPKRLAFAPQNNETTVQESE